MSYPQKESGNNNSNIFTGLIIIIIGIGVLFRIAPPFKELIPYWVTSWPMLLIVIGLLVGVKDNFRNNAWIVLILIGGAFLIFRNGFLPKDLRVYVLPIGIILFGLYVMLNRSGFRSKKKVNFQTQFGIEHNTTKYNSSFVEEDYLSIKSFMSGSERVVISKKFKGGNASSVFSGVVIDCSQADIEDIAELNVSVLFSGLELRIPSNWEVKNQASVIAGAIEDKRNFYAHNTENNKTLIIKGSVMFGGIEIKN